MPTKTKPKEKVLAEFEVEFGTVSLTDERIKLACKIYRADLDGDLCCPKCGGFPLEKYLSQKRLQGVLEAQPRGISSNHRPLPGFEDELRVEGQFDVKGYSFGDECVNFSLSTGIDGNLEQLIHYPKRSGHLAIFGVAILPSDEEEGLP